MSIVWFKDYILGRGQESIPLLIKWSQFDSWQWIDGTYFVLMEIKRASSTSQNIILLPKNSRSHHLLDEKKRSYTQPDWLAGIHSLIKLALWLLFCSCLTCLLDAQSESFPEKVAFLCIIYIGDYNTAKAVCHYGFNLWVSLILTLSYNYKQLCHMTLNIKFSILVVLQG